MYPEHYRKSSEHVKGSNVTTPEPFCIGFISSIVTRSRDKLVASSDICLRVKKMYRPENTHRDAGLSHQLDLNQIYWTDEGNNFIICSKPITPRSLNYKHALLSILNARALNTLITKFIALKY